MQYKLFEHKMQKFQQNLLEITTTKQRQAPKTQSDDLFSSPFLSIYCLRSF